MKVGGVAGGNQANAAVLMGRVCVRVWLMHIEINARKKALDDQGLKILAERGGFEPPPPLAA